MTVRQQLSRFYEFLDRPLFGWSRVVLALLVIPLVLAFGEPLWKISLRAPQYPNGLWMDVANSIYVEGQSKNDEWDAAKAWLDKYDHPLWKRWHADAEGAGHGGMDFFVIHAFIESIKRKTPTPQDVYDAATWSAITPLSEQSIELGNATVAFPDFTGGNWMYRKADFGLSDEY